MEGVPAVSKTSETNKVIEKGEGLHNPGEGLKSCHIDAYYAEERIK